MEESYKQSYRRTRTTGSVAAAACVVGLVMLCCGLYAYYVYCSSLQLQEKFLELVKDTGPAAMEEMQKMVRNWQQRQWGPLGPLVVAGIGAVLCVAGFARLRKKSSPIKMADADYGNPQPAIRNVQ